MKLGNVIFHAVAFGIGMVIEDKVLKPIIEKKFGNKEKCTTEI